MLGLFFSGARLLLYQLCSLIKHEKNGGGWMGRTLPQGNNLFSSGGCLIVSPFSSGGKQVTAGLRVVCDFCRTLRVQSEMTVCKDTCVKINHLDSECLTIGYCIYSVSLHSFKL